MQQQLHHLQQPLAMAMQQAVVTGMPEPLGQHMTQQHPQKPCPCDALDHLPACVVSRAKRDHAISIREDILLTQHATVERTPQIDKCLLTLANRLAVHNPVPRDWCVHAQAHSPHPLQPFGKKHLGKIGHREEISLDLSAPLFPICFPWLLLMDGIRRDNQVNMGMAVKPPVVCMQNRMRSGDSFQPGIPTGE